MRPYILTLESFEPIDVTLRLAVAPTFADGIPNSGEVIANGIGESAQSVQAGSVGIVQPTVEFGRCHAVRNEKNVARKGGALHLTKRILPSNSI